MQKTSMHDFTFYPILKDTGALAASNRSPVQEIVNRKELPNYTASDIHSVWFFIVSDF